ncbi:DUF6221 family protein [Streptosporangium saharense]|uniref:DUF6221 family protein n=1 Tax=Streptosporangium saharense TaxID=1706840 RepID=UPI0036AC9944
MDDLVALLLSGLAKDEKKARAAESGDDSEHVLQHSPARVLRDVEAKRRIVTEYVEALRVQTGFRETDSEESRREALELVCRALVTPYIDEIASPGA